MNQETSCYSYCPCCSCSLSADLLFQGYAALRAESEARLQAESHVANTKAHVSRLVSELEAAKV